MDVKILSLQSMSNRHSYLINIQPIHCKLHHQYRAAVLYRKVIAESDFFSRIYVLSRERRIQYIIQINIANYCRDPKKTVTDSTNTVFKATSLHVRVNGVINFKHVITSETIG